LDIASWLAFIVFAATAFKPFSHRWLRVTVVFLVFYLLRFAVAALVARTYRLVPFEWFFLWLRVTLLSYGAIKLAMPGSFTFGVFAASPGLARNSPGHESREASVSQSEPTPVSGLKSDIAVGSKVPRSEVAAETKRPPTRGGL
jgi:hypothetical protein